MKLSLFRSLLHIGVGFSTLVVFLSSTPVYAATATIAKTEDDTTPPFVVSSVLASNSPTNAASVGFIVTFSEAVSGVDTSDFMLSSTGVSGPIITQVTGSDTTYTVTVNTSTGNGTIRLDVLDDDTIIDTANNALSGAFNTGETYTIDKNVTIALTSIAAHDGWIIENSENGKVGATLDKTSTTLRIGDDSSKRQYRSILSFNTSRLPDSAQITSITLNLKKQSIVGSENPILLLNSLLVEIKTGLFGLSGLELTDFQALPSRTLGPYTPTLANNWYNVKVKNGLAYINKTSANGGLTQIRLRFKLDDNNDTVANYLSIYSSNATNAADRPQLVIKYYMP